jgi:hypothetical protein
MKTTAIFHPQDDRITLTIDARDLDSLLDRARFGTCAYYDACLKDSKTEEDRDQFMSLRREALDELSKLRRLIENCPASV